MIPPLTPDKSTFDIAEEARSFEVIGLVGADAAAPVLQGTGFIAFGVEADGPDVPRTLR